MKKCFLQLLIVFYFSVFSFAEFTVGLYGVKTSTDIINAKEAGFNCVQCYEKDSKIIKTLADEAVKNEMKLIVYPDRIIESKKDRNIVNNYPIKAWYLFEEPDVHGLTRNELIALNNNVKKIYPNNKTTFLIRQGFTQVSYYDIADILMVNWYPVTHFSLENFGENIALAKQGLLMVEQEKKELWAVIKIFVWKDYEQYKENEDRIGHFLKKEEIRFMSYDAIFNGATGLFYFNCYYNKKILSQEKPKEWAKVVEIVQEMSFIGEIMDNGKEIDNPIDVKEPIKAKSFEYGGIKYTFIINPTAKRQTIPNLFFEPKFDVIYEKSTNLRKIARKSKNNFPPYRIFSFRYE